MALNYYCLEKDMFMRGTEIQRAIDRQRRPGRRYSQHPCVDAGRAIASRRHPAVTVDAELVFGQFHIDEPHAIPEGDVACH